MTGRCKRGCCWSPFGGVCPNNYDCFCHRESPAQESARRSRELAESIRTARHKRVPDATQRAILAASLGIDSAVEVARRHKVPIGAVREIWKAN